MKFLQKLAKNRIRFFQNMDSDNWDSRALNIDVININLNSHKRYGKYLGNNIYLYSQYEVIAFIVNTSTPEDIPSVEDLISMVTFEIAVKALNHDILFWEYGLDYVKHTLTQQALSDIANSEDYVKLKKRDLLKGLAKLQKSRNYLDFLSKGIHNIPYKYSKRYNTLVFKVKDIQCEDTQGRLETFPIKHLTFGIDVVNKRVKIVHGERKVSGFSGRMVYHPHQLNEDGRVCLGTLEPDIIEAITMFNFDVLNILLTKFASVYTSSDAAGEYAKNFIETWKQNLSTNQDGE